LSKQEFVNFIRTLLNGRDCPFSESEIGDLFLFFCKKLDPNQTAPQAESSLGKNNPKGGK